MLGKCFEEKVWTVTICGPRVVSDGLCEKVTRKLRLDREGASHVRSRERAFQEEGIASERSAELCAYLPSSVN